MGVRRPSRRGPDGRGLHAPPRVAVLERGALAVLALLWAGAAAAQQSFPWRFDVAGVAAGDALNVRARPSASAPVLDTLAPDARGVEVVGVSPDGAWARVPLGEGEGWASLRHLRAQAGDPRAVPAPLACLGTEPFWALTVAAGGGVWEFPDEDARALRLVGEAAGFSGFALAFDDRGGARDLTVLRAECSDGMSDRPYGFAALVWDREGELFEGCCRLLPE